MNTIKYFIDVILNNQGEDKFDKEYELGELKLRIHKMFRRADVAMFNTCIDNKFPLNIYDSIKIDIIELKNSYIREIDKAISNL